MTVFAGQGDAARSMALLWRRQTPGNAAGPARTAPGPKPGLTVDAIVDAAIAVADAHGLGGLSMRAVADRLGRTAMALYTYVPGKGELLDLMHDRAHAELPAEYDLDQGWRAALTSWAEHLLAFYLRHPWALQVSQARSALGPHEQAVLESLLRILHDTGLPARVVRRVVGVMFQVVRGTAQIIAESRIATTATGVSDQEWWSTRSALLHELAPDFAERFPMTVWLGSDGVVAAPPGDSTPYLEREADETFSVGLAIVLDGIEATLARESADRWAAGRPDG